MDRPIVTLLTDFGLSDAYVAQLKAAILSRVDAVELVDITHGVEPFGILQAGWLLGTTYGHFPRGSIHLCVVDPGVGTSRAALIVLKDGHAFVGPDNGVFSFIYPAEQVIEVTWRPSTPVSGPSTAGTSSPRWRQSCSGRPGPKASAGPAVIP